MPADLYTRVVANAYRLVGASPGGDHLAIRKAAERACARAKLGAHARADDGLPALAAHQVTEAKLKDALTQLLVPRLRLEERAFSPALPASSLHDLAETHAKALDAVIGGQWRRARDLWAQLHDADAFWNYLTGSDLALPRAQGGDVERARQELPRVLVEGVGATVSRSIMHGAYATAAAAVPFLEPAVWTNRLVEPQLKAARQALDAKLVELHAWLGAATLAQVVAATIDRIGPLWGLVLTMNLHGHFYPARDAMAPIIMRALEAAAADPALHVTAVKAYEAAAPLLQTSQLAGRYGRLREALQNPALIVTSTPVSAPVVAAPAPVPEPIASVSGGVCALHGPVPLARGVCLACQNAGAAKRSLRARLAAWARHVLRQGGAVMNALLIIGVIAFLLYPGLVMLGYTAFWLLLVLYLGLARAWRYLRPATGRICRGIGHWGEGEHCRLCHAGLASRTGGRPRGGWGWAAVAVFLIFVALLYAEGVNRALTLAAACVMLMAANPLGLERYFYRDPGPVFAVALPRKIEHALVMLAHGVVGMIFSGFAALLLVLLIQPAPLAPRAPVNGPAMQAATTPATPLVFVKRAPVMDRVDPEDPSDHEQTADVEEHVYARRNDADADDYADAEDHADYADAEDSADYADAAVSGDETGGDEW